MHYPLLDITERIAEDPKWWLQGIPRYCDYDPREATFSPTNLLVRVCCQQCHRTFDIAFGTKAKLKENIVDPVMGYPLDSDSGRPIVEAHDDPPFHLGKDGYNCAGNSAIAVWVAILQAWEGYGRELRRRADLEGPSPDSPI